MRWFFFACALLLPAWLMAAPSPSYRTITEPFFVNPPWWTLDKSDTSETIRRAYDSAGAQGSRFAWGGYDAGTANAVAIDNQTLAPEPRRSQLNFNMAASVAGSYAYTRFDTSTTDFASGATNASVVANASAPEAAIELDVTLGNGEQVAVLIRDNNSWWCSDAMSFPLVAAGQSAQTLRYSFAGTAKVEWKAVSNFNDMDQVDNGGETSLEFGASGTPNLGAIQGMGLYIVSGTGASAAIGEMRLLAPDPAPVTGDEVKMRLCAPAWRNIGGQDPGEVAKKFTVIFGHLDPAPFHAGNPQTKCFKYYLGPYVSKAVRDSLPREALASDSTGGFVKAKDWENWLIVPDNPKWIEYHVGVVTNFLKAHPEWDGIFEDSMGTAPVEGGYLLTDPINPNTGKVYTKSDWLAAEQVMLDAVRKALPAGKQLTMNGLAQCTRYWTTPESDSPRALLPYVDGAMAELTWRSPTAGLSAWPSLSDWNKTISMIGDVQARGMMGFWWTKMWGDGNTSNNEPNASVLVPQWRRFTLASVLLAAGSKTHYNFDTMKNDNNAAEMFAEYYAPLGAATGTMTPLNVANVYGRPFTGGIVLVNPNTTDAANVTIPWTAWKGKTLVAAGEGKSYTEPFTIPAHTGMILTGQSTAARNWNAYSE